MDIAIMIEGQNGLDWPHWQRLAFAVEELGFAGLYRSDHYTNANPPDKASLECWVSLTWLASHTRGSNSDPWYRPFHSATRPSPRGWLRQSMICPMAA